MFLTFVLNYGQIINHCTGRKGSVRYYISPNTVGLQSETPHTMQTVMRSPQHRKMGIFIYPNTAQKKSASPQHLKFSYPTTSLPPPPWSPKSVSVSCVNRTLWDEHPLRSKFFSLWFSLCKFIHRRNFSRRRDVTRNMWSHTFTIFRNLDAPARSRLIQVIERNAS